MFTTKSASQKLAHELPDPYGIAHSRHMGSRPQSVSVLSTAAAIYNIITLIAN